MRTKPAVVASLSTRTSTIFMTVLAVVLGITATTATSSAAPPTPGAPVHAWVKHTTPTAELGVPHPAGVAYSPAEAALLVTGARTPTGTPLVATTPAGRRLASLSVPDALSPTAVTVDPAAGRLLGVAGGTLVEVDTSGAVSGTLEATHAPANGALPANPSDLAFDAASRQLFALDPATRTVAVADVTTDGAATPAGEISLGAVPSGDVAGLAYNGSDHLLYAAVPSRHSLYAVDRAGAVRLTYDMSEVPVESFQSMTFAPTADNTDSSAATSLYVADGGAGSQLGSLTEVYLTPQVVTAATATATLVKTTATSTFNPPSPDPDGITLLPSGELLMADGEVDEIPSLFQNVNLWTITRGGSVTGTGFTTPGTPLPGLKSEPTGVSYDSRTDHVFVSDDDQQKIYEIAKGADGKFGTTDDTFASFSMSTLFTKFGIPGTPDPEDVTIDTRNGNLYVIDGVGSEVYDVSPGPDGKFGGTGAADNNLTHFDVAALGATDPEGIYYYAATDTLFVVDHGSHKVYEVTTTGQLAGAVSIAAAGGMMEAAITVAPASSGAGMSFYIVDRRVDNNDVTWPPGENDGKLYEFLTDLSGGGTPVPSVSAGADQSLALGQAASLTATATDGTNPYPPAGVTVAWSKVTGPAGGVATFASPAALSTTVTFSAVGSYTLRVTVTPTGGKAMTDDVVVTVISPTQNFVANPGFEAAATGWNTNGSTPSAPPTRVTPGHTGAYAAAVTTSAGVCSLTDSPNSVATTTTVAAPYTASMWVRGATAGAKFQLLLREYAGTPSALKGSMAAAATLTTGWQLVSVTYTPAAPGTSTLDVLASVTGPAAGTCFIADDVSVTVGAPGAKVAVAPSSVAFAQAGTAGTQAVTVTNTGTLPTAVTAAGVGGEQGADFAVTPPACVGTLLSVGQSCQITVTFTPTAVGPRAATLATVAAAAQTAVALTGTGQSTLVATPSALDFGQQLTGTTSLEKVVTVQNASGLTVGPVTATVAGAQATSFTATPSAQCASVAPAASCTVSVKFTPAAAVAATATLTIGGATSPVSVGLGGLGVAPLALAAASLPGGVVGNAYSATLSASGGTGPYSWAVTQGSLPSGLSLSDGKITGTPKNVGTASFTITVDDPSVSPTASRAFTIAVAAAMSPLSVTTTSLPDGVVNAAYSTTLAATGGTPPYHWSASSKAGLSLSPGGVLSGIPTQTGVVTFTFTVTDSGSRQAVTSLSLTVAPAVSAARGALSDFNRDGKAEIAVYRPSNGTWYLRGIGSIRFGIPGDIPVAADYNRDGKAEIAVYRPSNGVWYIRGIATRFQYGAPGDIPVPGDYNRDGKAEIAVYRPSTGTWHIRGLAKVQFGMPGDVPVLGDYNGDRRTEIAVYRPSNGVWYIRGIATRFRFGAVADIPVPADYNRNGKAEIAVFRPSNGTWYIRGIATRFQYGAPGDIPVAGDYNRDRGAEIAVFRPSNGVWYIRGIARIHFGAAGDIPV